MVVFFFYFVFISKYIKYGVLSMEIIKLMGILNVIRIFFVSVLVRRNKNVLIKVEIGISVWWCGLVSFLVKCGVISLRKVILLAVVIYDVVRVIVEISRMCCFFLIWVLSFIVSWLLSCSIFKYFVLYRLNGRRISSYGKIDSIIF